MPSSTASEIFVHARLSDGTKRLVGRYRHQLKSSGRPLGEFEYVGSWLRNDHGQAFPLDPVNLPLSSGVFTTLKRAGLFGVLADTTPDRWGRRLHRILNPGFTSEIEWLLSTGDERVGCLEFSGDPTPRASAPDFLPYRTLPQIADAFDCIMRGEDADPRLAALYRAGRSLGGVRPKAVIEHEGCLWIAKFQRHDDEIDQCAAEHATMQLALICGIRAAETRLVNVGANRNAVLVKRFDRSLGPIFHPTAHFLSASSVLDIDDTSSEGSYLQIAGVLRQHAGAHVRDREELYRRMVFNVLCGNRDDHLKNHALLYDGEWRLSPAFDVVPQIEILEQAQAIAVGAFGSIPTVENCLTRCGEFGLRKDEASEIVGKMIEQMRPWKEIFLSFEVPRRTIDRLQHSFVLIQGTGISA